MILVPALLAAVAVSFVACNAGTATGGIDTSFAGTGFAITSFGTGDDEAFAVAVQSDGKIVAAGRVTDATGGKDFGIARYLSDGTIDTAFGGTGQVTLDFSLGLDEVRAVAIQTDGRMVVAGTTTSGTVSRVALARFLTDGTADTSFGGGGKVSVALGAAGDTGRGVAIQSDGKILVSGTTVVGANNAFLLARYNADGSPDTTFNLGASFRSFALGNGNDQGTGMSLLRTGATVVSGSARFGPVNHTRFAVAKFTSTGTVDTTFGLSGFNAVNFGSNPGTGADTQIVASNDIANAIATLSDGSLILAGTSNDGTSDRFGVAKYAANGELDSTFGTAGLVIVSFGPGNAAGRAAAVLSDRALYVAGNFNGTSNGTSTRALAVARLSATGTVDRSFGSNGIVLTEFYRSGTQVGTGQANAMAIQTDGKVLVAGYAAAVSGGQDFVIVRYR